MKSLTQNVDINYLINEYLNSNLLTQHQLANQIFVLGQGIEDLKAENEKNDALNKQNKLTSCLLEIDLQWIHSAKQSK